MVACAGEGGGGVEVIRRGGGGVEVVRRTSLH